MQYSKNGLHLTESFEGCKFVSYWDNMGHCWTIGYGHTRGVTEGMTCTQEQAEQWLLEDVASAEASVNRLVKVPLTQGEFDAMVDFVFNIGGGNKFLTSTLLHVLNQGNYTAAAAEFDKWDLAGGKVVAGILRRREAETAEFKAGASA
jgi:lysozyme